MVAATTCNVDSNMMSCSAVGELPSLLQQYQFDPDWEPKPPRRVSGVQGKRVRHPTYISRLHVSCDMIGCANNITVSCCLVAMVQPSLDLLSVVQSSQSGVVYADIPVASGLL